MEFLISILALLISIYTLIVASRLRRRIMKIDGESLYRSSQIREAREHLEQRISILGRFVAMASQGRRLTEEQVLEDRLFDDIDSDGALELMARNEALSVDVREPHEYASGHIPAAILVPVSQLEERWKEVPRDRTVIVYCASGQSLPFRLSVSESGEGLHQPAESRGRNWILERRDRKGNGTAAAGGSDSWSGLQRPPGQLPTRRQKSSLEIVGPAWSLLRSGQLDQTRPGWDSVSPRVPRGRSWGKTGRKWVFLVFNLVQQIHVDGVYYGPRMRKADSLACAESSARPARVHQPGLHLVRLDPLGQQLSIAAWMPDQERGPKTGRKSGLGICDPNLGSSHFRRVSANEVVHGCSGVRRLTGGRTPKASQVRKRMLEGWPDRQGIVALGINSMG